MAAQEAVNTEAEITEKWYIRYNPSKRPKTFYFAFIVLFVILDIPVLSFFAMKKTIFKPVYICASNFPEIYYVYSIVVIDSILILFVTFKLCFWLNFNY